MSISDTHKTLIAVVGIAGLSVAGWNYFLPRGEAAEQIAAAKAEQAKSVEQLRVEVLLNRVKQLNDKAKPTADEQTEKALLMEQIKTMQAEMAKQQVKK